MRALLGALRHPREHDWRHLRPWQRHSLVVGVGGIVYILVGAAYLSDEPPAARVASLHLAADVLPLRAWGIVWIVVGLGAVISARWPPASKKWGYSLLAALSVCWSAMYGIGWLISDAATTSLSGACVWGLVGFLWWGIAGLDNPDDVLAMVADPDRWRPDPGDDERGA